MSETCQKISVLKKKSFFDRPSKKRDENEKKTIFRNQFFSGQIDILSFPYISHTSCARLLCQFRMKYLRKKVSHVAIHELQKSESKLLPWVNFTNILQAAFAPIFLPQKSTNLKSNYKKASRETFVQKTARIILVKLTPYLCKFAFFHQNINYFYFI